MTVLSLVVAAGALSIATPSESISRTARTYLGETYIYGDTGERGYDCSGFVQTVFRDNGYALPRTSKEQGNSGKPVKAADLRPGDLLFFSYKPGSKYITHVGIALDHNHMIHASRAHHRVVISKLDTKYYRNRLVATRRIKHE